MGNASFSCFANLLYQQIECLPVHCCIPFLLSACMISVVPHRRERAGHDVWEAVWRLGKC